MSLKHMDWVWHKSEAKKADRLVLLYLACASDGRGRCSISQSKLAEFCNANIRTIRRSINNLVELGEIEAEPDPEWPTGLNRPTRYQLKIKQVV